MAERGQHHGGVVFIAEHTLRRWDYGGQISALIALWDAHHAEDWSDRCVFLRAVRPDQ